MLGINSPGTLYMLLYMARFKNLMLYRLSFDWGRSDSKNRWSIGIC